MAPETLVDLLAEEGIRPKSYAPGHTEKLICPRCGGGRSREQSLSLTIDDDAMGAAWKCHRGHCGWSHGGRIASADRRRGPLPSEVSRPIQKPVAHSPEQQARPQWLYGWFEDRRISRATVDAFGCYAARHWFPDGGEQEAIVFPYRHGGELVNRKYRSRDKQLMQDKDPLPSLEPAWRVRRRRLEARNAAIRDARAFFPEEADWPAARAMERALAACVDAQRRRRLAGLPPDPVAPGTRTEAVRRIADLNEGCELERRTIFNALREGAG